MHFFDVNSKNSRFKDALVYCNKEIVMDSCVHIAVILWKKTDITLFL